MAVETQKSALGKGLKSLLLGADLAQPQAAPSAAVVASYSPPPPTTHSAIPGITFLPVSEIQVNQYQPRRQFENEPLEELAQSIRVSGVIQPLVVRRTDSGYQLIAGERRLRASQIAGLKQVPVVVRRTTDKEALELALVENIQRQDLNCVDEALAYQQLMTEFQLTQEDVASRVGKDRATVANFLRILKLPEAVLGDLKSGELSFGHAKALLSVDDPERRLELRQKILNEKLSVRQTEALAQQTKSTSSASLGAAETQPGPATDPVRARFLTLSQGLTRLWSARVEIQGSRKKGKVVFHYDNPEQLERMLSAMQNPQTWQSHPQSQ